MKVIPRSVWIVGYIFVSAVFFVAFAKEMSNHYSFYSFRIDRPFTIAFSILFIMAGIYCLLERKTNFSNWISASLFGVGVWLLLFSLESDHFLINMLKSNASVSLALKKYIFSNDFIKNISFILFVMFGVRAISLLLEGMSISLSWSMLLIAALKFIVGYVVAAVIGTVTLRSFLSERNLVTLAVNIGPIMGVIGGFLVLYITKNRKTISFPQSSLSTMKENSQSERQEIQEKNIYKNHYIFPDSSGTSIEPPRE